MERTELTTTHRLLYLSFAWPPGVAALYPDWNPAGHGLETQMTAALRQHIEIRSIGLFPFEIGSRPQNADPSSGIDHDFITAESKPELWGRLRALWRIKSQFGRWLSEGWKPDLVLVYNLSPVYNQIIRWLRRRAKRPRLVLLLLDSSQLGNRMSAWRRFRYRFKPFTVLDEDMLSQFDSCIGLSTGVEKYVAAHQLPFLWMPGGCSPERATTAEPRASLPDRGPLQFGYFGALASHAGVMEMAKAFLEIRSDATLHICGYGKLTAALSAMADQNPRIKYRGLLTPEDCLLFGQSCDVLVNPRPLSHGNENNFPSKLFEYALCGRAIIASRLSGADRVLGPEAFYFEPNQFEASLRTALEQTTATPRDELRRRGAAIRKRVTEEFNWPAQAVRMAEFLKKI